ncbi:MAG: hypothetical protein Q9159_006991 [Coniocarpon cinnabarinum]
MPPAASYPDDPGPDDKATERDIKETTFDSSYFDLDSLAAHQRSATADGLLTPSTMVYTPSASTPGTPYSFSRPDSVMDNDDLDSLPPLDRLTVFDFLENLALPQRLERLQNVLAAQTEKVRRSQVMLKAQSQQARERVVDELRKRVTPPDERLQKYRKRMSGSVNRLTDQFYDSRNVTKREKASFIAGVLNIFISGYLIGAFPAYFHLWYTLQFAYFYPLRFYMYRRKGFHYFLADLCYYVNFLLLASIWIFPQSRRLFISAFCLGFGNNAIAIAMWRNSLVFHSFDKVTSLFIHVMPCVTLHCLVHLVPPDIQRERFPGVYAIKYAPTEPSFQYSLLRMALWSSIPYAFWQIAYHCFITVRKREKISAGRPTSFTWLRKSFRNTWIGKIVLSLPENLQEPAFMLIQYGFALLTMLPVPIWFWSRWASAAFLLSVFTWSVWNGAVYYIDVFGVRFQKELDQLKRDVAKWQNSPELAPRSPVIGSAGQVSTAATEHKRGSSGEFTLSAPAMSSDGSQSSSTGASPNMNEAELKRAAAANAMKGGTESTLVASPNGILERKGGADGSVSHDKNE